MDTKKGAEENATTKTVYCSICSNSERVTVRPSDVVYFEDILRELGWKKGLFGWVCPEHPQE